MVASRPIRLKMPAVVAISLPTVENGVNNKRGFEHQYRRRKWRKSRQQVEGARMLVPAVVT